MSGLARKEGRQGFCSSCFSFRLPPSAFLLYMERQRMYYVVTGAAGFIGSNLVKALNERGVTDIIAVDDMRHGDKFVNLADCDIADYLDKDEFLEKHRGRRVRRRPRRHPASGRVLGHDRDRRPLHDAEQLRATRASCSTIAMRDEVHFIYASVGRVLRRRAGSSARRASARRRSTSTAIRSSCSTSWCGGASRSAPRRSRACAISTSTASASSTRAAWRRWRTISSTSTAATGHVRLFEGSGGYGDGEQRRDFVSVEDCVKVNLFFLDHPGRSGIFNVGTGAAQSFNDVAVATVNACRKARGEAPLTLAAMRERGVIQYIPFPGGPQGPVPELHAGRHRGAAQRGLRCAVPHRGTGRRALLSETAAAGAA